MGGRDRSEKPLAAEEAGFSAVCDIPRGVHHPVCNIFEIPLTFLRIYPALEACLWPMEYNYYYYYYYYSGIRAETSPLRNLKIPENLRNQESLKRLDTLRARIPS